MQKFLVFLKAAPILVDLLTLNPKHQFCGGYINIIILSKDGVAGICQSVSALHWPDERLYLKYNT